MCSPEFKAKELKLLEECGGSCSLADRKLNAVSAKTLYRWRREDAKPPKRRYAHLSPSQKSAIAKQLQEGLSASVLADRYGVSVTTVYNIRDAFRERRCPATKTVEESLAITNMNPVDLPVDIEEL